MNTFHKKFSFFFSYKKREKVVSSTYWEMVYCIVPPSRIIPFYVFQFNNFLCHELQHLPHDDEKN
jgi:hypothetical protein